MSRSTPGRAWSSTSMPWLELALQQVNCLNKGSAKTSIMGITTFISHRRNVEQSKNSTCLTTKRRRKSSTIYCLKRSKKRNLSKNSRRCNWILLRARYVWTEWIKICQSLQRGRLTQKSTKSTIWTRLGSLLWILLSWQGSQAGDSKLSRKVKCLWVNSYQWWLR